MNRMVLVIAAVFVCSTASFSQIADTRSRTAADANARTSATKAGRNVSIESGTRLAGELQNTVDVRKARVGDEVVLKTTQAIKSQGRTVLNKGARLVGHITEVAQNTKARDESRVGILFDKLESGSLEVPIAARITSIGSTRTRNNDQDVFSSDTAGNASASSRSSAQRQSASGSQSNGSLVGGVTSSVGGAVNG